MRPVAFVSLLLVGCSSVPHGPSLPVRHSIVRDQLVVYSDFPLPPRHRLLNELAAQRSGLSAKLQLPVSDEPIHVYLFESDATFQDFIGEHYPDFPDRRAFFVETDTRLAIYAQWGVRTAEDLRHEVSHGYLHAALPGLPLWLDEGLAEYFEVPRPQQGLNRPHAEQLVARIEQGDWRPNMKRLESIGSAADLTQLDYAESWAWVYFLLETNGERRELLREYLRSLREEGNVPPLSERIGELDSDPDGTLAEYVRSLRRN